MSKRIKLDKSELKTVYKWEIKHFINRQRLIESEVFSTVGHKNLKLKFICYSEKNQNYISLFLNKSEGFPKEAAFKSID